MNIGQELLQPFNIIKLLFFHYSLKKIYCNIMKILILHISLLAFNGEHGIFNGVKPYV